MKQLKEQKLGGKRKRNNVYVRSRKKCRWKRDGIEQEQDKSTRP